MKQNNANWGKQQPFLPFLMVYIHVLVQLLLFCTGVSVSWLNTKLFLRLNKMHSSDSGKPSMHTVQQIHNLKLSLCTFLCPTWPQMWINLTFHGMRLRCVRSTTGINIIRHGGLHPYSIYYSLIIHPCLFSLYFYVCTVNPCVISV